MKMIKTLSLLSLLLLVYTVFVRASVEPVFVDSSKSTFTSRGESLTYPNSQNSDDLPYFSDNLNFNAIDGKILVGAADKLFSLDNNLRENGVYTWTTDTSQGTTCPSNDDVYVCRNHIRIYQQPVINASTLFVCGTQSGIQPQCRILNINGTSLSEAGAPNATNLVSAHPDLPGFGEFRQENEMDNVYFSANYKSVETTSFDLSYQQVDFESGGGVSTSRLHGWQEGDSAWLNSPLAFVDYQRADYPSDDGYRFYFVFLRERLWVQDNGDETEVITRVVRLCRNDAGVSRETTPAPNGAQDRIFTSFIKAKIFCEREMPPGQNFVGAQDFIYNEMWSAAFNSPNGGRYHETTQYVHMVYGAFSGPRVGPIGTAICVYRADVGNPSSSEGLTGGIFDVFRNDVINPNTGVEIENNYLRCNEGGRSPTNSQGIVTVQDVRQIGDDPLLVFDGFYVTQMVVDQVCVVKRSDNSSCVNQDVLFLGTSDGRVLKVVFASGEPGSGSVPPISPVIAEDIQLNNTNPVKEMQINVVGSSKQLYIVTSSTVYRIPLERCSRHGNNFTACIQSRDPYCVWDSSQASCVRSPLTASGSQTGTVPVYLQQNVHTANVTLARVGFQMASYSTREGAAPEERLRVTVESDRAVTDGVVEVDIVNMTAKVGVNVFSAENPISISLEEASGNPPVYRHSFTIEARRDGRYNGNLQFGLRLRSTLNGAVVFTQQNATVTIIDIDGTLFRVGFHSLAVSCMAWTSIYKNATTLLSTEIAQAIGRYPADFVVNTTLVCNNRDDKYVTLVGALLTTDELSVSDLLNSLNKWINTGPEIKSLNIQVDPKCSVSIQTTLDAACPAVDIGGVANPPPQTSASLTAVGLGVALAIFGIITSILIVVVVFLSVLLWSRRHNSRSSSPEVSPKRIAPQDTGMKNGYSDQPHQHRQSLAERKRSKELQIDIETAKMFHPSDPHPSSQPLKMDFFNESPEEKTPNMLNDTFDIAGALEKSPSPIHMDGGASNEPALNRASIEVCQNIRYEKVSLNGRVVNEQAV